MLSMRMVRCLIALLALFCLATFAEDDPFASVRGNLETCFSCHGAEGVSNSPQYPILAGQEFYYIYVQLKDFKSGLRSNDIMSPIAAQLEKEDMKLLAKYFSEQEWPVVQEQGDASSSNNSKALAAINSGQCVACHLSGFEGDSRVPRLAGQHTEYLRKTMFDFKSKARNNSPSKSSLMGAMSEQDIELMALYLGALAPRRRTVLAPDREHCAVAGALGKI